MKKLIIFQRPLTEEIATRLSSSNPDHKAEQTAYFQLGLMHYDREEIEQRVQAALDFGLYKPTIRLDLNLQNYPWTKQAFEANYYTETPEKLTDDVSKYLAEVFDQGNGYGHRTAQGMAPYYYQTDLQRHSSMSVGDVVVDVTPQENADKGFIPTKLSAGPSLDTIMSRGRPKNAWVCCNSGWHLLQLPFWESKNSSDIAALFPVPENAPLEDLHKCLLVDNRLELLRELNA